MERVNIQFLTSANNYNSTSVVDKKKTIFHHNHLKQNKIMLSNGFQSYNVYPCEYNKIDHK